MENIVIIAILVVILGLGGLVLSPIFLIAAMILGFVAFYFILPSTDLEFEYLFVNGGIEL